MKKVLTLLFIIISINGYCQFLSIINFDTPYQSPWSLDSAWIDTTTYINHVWQIGIPQKTLFNLASSTPNAILTELNSFYPSNDTSSFVLKQRVGHPVIWPTILGISGLYKINSDSLKDYGIIEFSPDNGHSWVNLMDSSVNWDGNKPVFTGNINQWTLFSNFLFIYTQNVAINDTIWFKFTFISDSIQTNKEGWMIDDIRLNFIGEGLDEINATNNFSLSPNPFSQSTQITLNQTYHKITLAVYDIQGKQVTQQQCADCDKIQLSRNNLSNGLYFLKLTLDDKEVETGKIVIRD